MSMIKEIRNSMMDIDFNLLRQGKKKWMKGPVEIGEFFMDENNTFYDKGLKEAANALIQSKTTPFELTLARRYSTLTVINLRFLQPNFNWVDTKYTLMDKLAGFGGNFGIFAEITGCSLLALLNIIIIIFKSLFARALH